MLAALLGRQLKCSNFPGGKNGKRKEKQSKEKEKKKGREEGERKVRKVKGQNGEVYWERIRKCVKRNEGAWLATRKKNIFSGLGAKIGPAACSHLPHYCINVTPKRNDALFAVYPMPVARRS